jgi:hypothetical protein
MPGSQVQSLEVSLEGAEEEEEEEEGLFTAKAINGVDTGRDRAKSEEEEEKEEDEVGLFKAAVKQRMIVGEEECLLTLNE